jgi:protein-S-isoprenylcysteine O-methyltransferase Ste14
MIYFNRKIKIEEKLLLKKFGKEYGEYKKRVPRFL